MSNEQNPPPCRPAAAPAGGGDSATGEVGHTPGPWSLVADPFNDGVPYFRFSAGNSGYGEVEGGFSFTCIMQEADAALIAAAPELLAALEGLMPADFDEHPHDFHGDWHTARAAIEKARGE